MLPPVEEKWALANALGCCTRKLSCGRMERNGKRHLQLVFESDDGAQRQ